MEKYYSFEKKIDKLIQRRNQICFFNENSTTAMLDTYGVKEVEKLEARAKKHNLKSKEKIKKYDELIIETLNLMIKLGYSIEDIIAKYDLYDILNDNVELSSSISNTPSKK